MSAPPHARIAIVTGASRGIGAAIARRLHREGFRVAVVGRARDALEAVASEIGALPIVADVTSPGASERILAAVRSGLGEPDVVVPNAGIEGSYKLGDTTDERWDALLATNVTAVFRMCRAVLPGMVSRGWGRVIVVASSAGLTGYAYSAGYCASKHAVVGLVRGIAAELARTPVTINAVCPGFVDTSMSDRAAERIAAKSGRSSAEARAALEKLSPQHRLLAPEEVAHAVAALVHEDARGIHGQAIPIGVA